jgi:outer membrane lipoprotein-sorting protein
MPRAQFKPRPSTARCKHLGQQKFPGTVTIKRPLEELQILVTIQKLTVNLDISDDKFELKTPESATIQKMD